MGNIMHKDRNRIIVLCSSRDLTGLAAMVYMYEPLYHAREIATIAYCAVLWLFLHSEISKILKVIFLDIF